MPRAVLGATFITTGLLHFLRRAAMRRSCRVTLPAHRELVYASGVAGLAGGAGVLHPRAARPAAWLLIATLVAIFPANVEMAVRAERFRRFPRSLLWARLPVQGALIAWVWKTAGR